MRRAFAFAALLAAASALAQTKVSGGDTPPAAGQTAPASDKNPVAPDGSRRDTAKKALEAIKGNSTKDKRGTAGDAKTGR